MIYIISELAMALTYFFLGRIFIDLMVKLLIFYPDIIQMPRTPME